MDSATTDHRLAQARGLISSQQFAEGIKLFEELIRDGVEVDNAHLNIGAALIQQRKLREAIDYLSACKVDRPEIHLNIAAAAGMLGDLPCERAACVKILQTRQKQHTSPYLRLATIAAEEKNWQMLAEALQVLFEIDCDDFTTCYRLGEAHKELKNNKLAVTYFLKALELTEDEKVRATLHGALAGLYKDTGEQVKALHHFREAYRLQPGTNTCSNLIMDMQYTLGVTLKDFYGQCQEFSDRFLHALPRYQHSLERLDAGRAVSGLRIGWVSGDFKTHSLTNLMLEQFKRFKAVAPQHQHYLYSSIPESNETDHSKEYKQCGEWRCIHDTTDKWAADLICRQDKIDVLIDLAGHTGYNRLPLFGHKPAPVQMGYISGMMTPPALETVNYFITDPHITPPNNNCHEKLLFIDSCCSYFPISKAPDVALLPADNSGHITFGSTNNPCKLSKEVVLAWASVIRAVPKSRMIIKVYTQGTESWVKKLMAAAGVSEDRLAFVRNLPSTEDVMRLLTEKIDIFLDTWPCAGMLTSAEALWMGCPVITLIGDTFLHRQSWTLLCQIDRKEWGASTPNEFVQAAVKLALDRKELREARSTMRERMEKSPMRNPQLLAEQMLKRIEEAWVDWCVSRESLKRMQRALVA